MAASNADSKQCLRFREGEKLCIVILVTVRLYDWKCIVLRAIYDCLADAIYDCSCRHINTNCKHSFWSNKWVVFHRRTVYRQPWIDDQFWSRVRMTDHWEKQIKIDLHALQEYSATEANNQISERIKKQLSQMLPRRMQRRLKVQGNNCTVCQGMYATRQDCRFSWYIS